jgi:cytidine deaminase
MKQNLTMLIGKAIAASRQAYVPYSNFRVGAILVDTEGQIYSGCNVENASFPASICAERTALVKAISEGVRNFETIVIATKNGGSPCGICRQMLNEFSPEMRVVCVTFDGSVTIDASLNELLPHGFSHDDLIPPDTSG